MTHFAIAFPGQGSQSVGMLAELAEQHAVIKETFAEASQVLGYDLLTLVMDGPLEDLNKTWRTQPALLTACRPVAFVATAGWGNPCGDGGSQLRGILRAGLQWCTRFCRCRQTG